MPRSLPCLMLALAAVISPPALAAERPIVAIEAHSTVQRPHQDLRAELRSLVRREVDALDLSQAPRSARYALSASLVQLAAQTEDGKVRTTARVSVVLKNAQGGAVHAILSGSATTEASSAAAASAERGALEGAVQGALRRLPEAVKAAR